MILLSISLIYTIISINIEHKCNYKERYIKINGIVTNCTEKKEYTELEIKAKEKILVKSNNICPKLGTKVSVQGRVETPPNNTIFNSFNYKNYLSSKKIYHIINSGEIKITSNKINIFYIIKNNLKKHINKYNNKEYLETFILGDKSNIEKEVLESYQQNGISHLLALSGMHITLLSISLLFILNKINKKIKINYLIVIIILLMYTFITNASPSIVRAVSMFIILTINKILKIKINALNLFITVCSINLLYNPYIIYNIGFQFSYIVTFYLILSSEYITTKTNYVEKIFIISLIAFISGIPIQIINFHTINIISPLINILFVPYVSYIIYPLCILSLLIPPLDNLLTPFITLLETISLNLENINQLTLTLRHINIYVLIVYYIIITYTLHLIYQNKYQGLLLLVITIIIHQNINYLNKSMYIEMLDIGQGDSILISLPKNKGNILIDTGGSIYNKESKLIKNKTIPYLKSKGITKINFLVTSHGDYDHMGEAINLVNNFKVENVIFNCGPYNDLENELIKVLEKKNIKYYSCIKELNIDKYKLQFLNTKEYNNENDNSSVIYFNYKKYIFLFMGDASVEREKDILGKYNLKDIDFLKVGHHGSNTSSSEEFINSINPKYSLISVGAHNRYGHPKHEVLDILKNSKIYRTDIDGSIEIKLNKNGYKIRTCPP